MNYNGKGKMNTPHKEQLKHCPLIIISPATRTKPAKYDIEMNWLIQKYVIEKLTATQISILLGITPRIVRGILYRHKITRNTKIPESLLPVDEVYDFLLNSPFDDWETAQDEFGLSETEIRQIKSILESDGRAAEIEAADRRWHYKDTGDL